MLLFCPGCSNLLLVEHSATGVRLSCSSCPYINKIKRKISERTYQKLKEIDHVIMGGSAAWENVDSTDVICPTCNHPKAYFMQMQIRSADEPMTTFYRCCNEVCKHNWRD